VTAWRTRLAALRLQDDGAVSANSADSSAPTSAAGAIGTIGANGIGVERAQHGHTVPPAEPREHDVPERGAVAVHRAASPSPVPAAPEPLADGVPELAEQRPPSWTDPDDVPALSRVLLVAPRTVGHAASGNLGWHGSICGVG